MKLAKPYKFTNAAELEKKIEEYFNWCIEKDRPFTMSGLAYALDTDRSVLVQYSGVGSLRYDYSGIDPVELEKIHNALQRAKKRVQVFAEENLYREKGQVNGVIFALKNNHNWKDQQEVTTVTKDAGPDLSNMTTEEIQELVNKLGKQLEEK